MQIGDLYRQVRNRFRAANIPAAEQDAKVLVCSALNLTISELILNEATEAGKDAVQRVNAKADRRLEGMPVGRILGEREFYGRRFLLNAAALEPRPDTEVLIDAVLQRAAPEEPVMILDVGTGSGAIAVSLLAELPLSRTIAIDISEKALECATGNARLHNVSERFHPLCADYLSAFGKDRDGGPDWIVSNPPYIRTGELQDLAPEVSRHDPLLALDGGESGLDAYGKIVTEAARILAPGARIALEIGYDQAVAIEKQLRHHGFGAIEIIKDLAGHDRVILAQRT